ncbi:MAG: phage holin family protein [Acidobacteria bacterium]|nr:phage holin family protein [Acidobacteriota bacterium]
MRNGQERRLQTKTSLPDESLGNLLSKLAIQSASLVRDEIALAYQELREKGKALQSPLLVIAVGSFLALIAAGTLAAAIVLALSEYLKPWLAALLVAVLIGSLSVLLIAAGINQLKRKSLKPEKTLESLEEGKEWLKEIA